MTLLRFSIYCIGGIVLTMLWIVSSFASMSSSAQRDISGAEMILVPVICACVLIGVDLYIHAVAFGSRVVVRLKQYHPCPVCPITKGQGRVSRNLLFVAHAIGPVHAAVTYRLPILISREAEARYPEQDMAKIFGFTITRFTRDTVTIYIRDRDYMLHFVAANQAALK